MPDRRSRGGNLGRTDGDVFAPAVAARIRADDLRVLGTDAPLETFDVVPQAGGGSGGGTPCGSRSGTRPGGGRWAASRST